MTRPADGDAREDGMSDFEREELDARRQFDAGDNVGRERTQIAIVRALLDSERQVRVENQDAGLIERLNGLLDYLRSPRTDERQTVDGH